MKKAYLVLSLLFLMHWSQAQIVNIPDANFKEALISSNCVDLDGDGTFDADADINNDGEIQLTEAQAVLRLNVSLNHIESLEGIEAFTNIELLNCRNNLITDLDLTSNIALRTLISTSNLTIQLNLVNNTQLEHFECGACSLSDIDLTSFTQLKYLDLGQNSLAAIDVSQNINLEELLLYNNNLTSIDVSQNPNLKDLQFSRNPVSSLDVSQNPNLEKLLANTSSLSSLDISQNPNLVFLVLTSNAITSIDVSQQSNLERLYLKDNALTSIDVSQNPLLVELEISNNQISTLDVSNNPQLKTLFCIDNVLTTINVTQNPNLERFSFNQNSLTEIDITQNPNLTSLGCSENSLTSLNVTQNLLLKGIFCSYNMLTEIDITNNVELESIRINNNMLTTLDATFNPKLDAMYCHDNNLESFYMKNGVKFYFYDFTLYNNPDLLYICADEDEIPDLDFILSPYGAPTDHIVNSYCSLVPGGAYVTLEGMTILDANSNGCDVSDSIYPNMEYQLTYGSTTETIIANALGDYAIYLPEDDTYTITPQLENPTYFTVSPTSITVDTSTASNPTVQDFCITPNGTHDDVEVTMIPLEDARPGFDTEYKIIYENKGNTTLSGSVQLTFDDDIMDLVTANPIADTQALHSLTWNYTNLEPFETRTISLTMNINTPTDVPAVNGDDVLTYEVMVTPAADDETPDNNIMTLEQTVVNSFDPNDIRCLEGETVTTDYIGKYVHYLIRFENTGTASAVNVVVTDEIDTAKFDIATLRPVSSSHAMVTNIKNGNKVEFIFENINLPFDDATNDGYLVFKIKTLASLVENDTFENSAGIYFDFNAPIITNTATTLISNPLSIAEENLETAIKLYPNPAKELVQITSQTPIEKLELRTIQGKLIKSKNIQTTNFSSTVNISSLPTGIYLIKITTTKGTAIKKIVKQ